MNTEKILKELEERIIEAAKELSERTYTYSPATCIEYFAEDEDVNIDLYIYGTFIEDKLGTLAIHKIEVGFIHIGDMDNMEAEEIGKEIEKELNKRFEGYEY